MPENTRQLNIRIPLILEDNLNYYAHLNGLSKKDLVLRALTQYCVVEQEKEEYRKDNDVKNVRAKLNLQGSNPEGEPQPKAALVLY